MNNSNILFFFYFVFWIQLIRENRCTRLQATENTCLNYTHIEKLEKCEVCTQNSEGQNGVSNRLCFAGGVFERFFQCANEEDDYTYENDCNLKKYLIDYENFVSISVPAQQHNKTWACYFDLTNGVKGYKHRARFYVNQNNGCSNSTTFAIEKLPDPFQYRVKIHSGAIPGNV